MKKKLLGALAALIGLVVATGAVTYGLAYRFTENAMVERWEAPTPDVQLSTDPAVIERGRHLTRHVLLCAQCHGDDLGGQEPYLEVAGLMTINAPNLTSGAGSVVTDFSPADMARAIRYGVRPDGTAVAVMPVQNFTGISDADLGAVVAYLDTLPPVDREPAATVYRPMGRLLWYFDVFNLQAVSRIDLDSARPANPPAEPRELGEYLAHLSGCVDCHGATLSGGPIPGAPSDIPVPPNLTPHPSGLGDYTRKDFGIAVRSGRDRKGEVLDAFMPWSEFAGLSDAEIDALWVYFESLPAKESGGR